MTEQHSPRRSLALPLVGLVLLAVLASACARIASPEGWASPVLVPGDDAESEELLLVAYRDNLSAWKADGLSQKWAFPPPDSDDEVDVRALYGTPAATDDTILVPAWDDDEDGTLYALERDTGAVRWKFQTDGPLIGGVTVSDGTVYFGSSDGNVYAVDIESGDQRWQPFETDKEVWARPTVAGGTLYVTSLDGRLYALDPDNGNLRWAFQTDAGIASPPVVDEEAGLVYVGGFDNLLRAIDVNTHEERWSVQADNWFWTRPLLADGVLYAGSLDGSVYAVDVETGDFRWVRPFETDAPLRAAPLIVAGVLFVVDREGVVHAIDPESGTQAIDFPLDLDVDVLSDPLVIQIPGDDDEDPTEEFLVVSTDGDVIRIDPMTLQITDQRTVTGN